MSISAEAVAESRPDRPWLPELLPLALVLAYGAAVEAVAAAIGQSHRVAWTLYLPYAVPATVFLGLAGLAVLSLAALRAHPRLSLADALREETRRRGIDGATVLRSVPLLTALPVFLSLFSSFKSLIPILHPFSLDPALAELDRRIHFGADPWRIFEPLLAHPSAVRALDFLYHPLWSLLLFAAWTCLVLDRSRPTLRLQALIAIPAVWIGLGSIGGMLLSSAGPCYFAQVGGAPDPYAPLLAELARIDAQAPLVSRAAQEALWSLYRSGAAGFGSGISAMPSVHVASALLLTLIARRRAGGALFAAAFVFFIAICIGSVVLGWHYAVDAYAGIALALPLWMFCGALARRLTRVSRIIHERSGYTFPRPMSRLGVGEKN